jgi:hypothetical protein
MTTTAEIIERAADAAPPVSSVTYPITLRDGAVVVRIAGLPDDLTREEAERISRIVLALALEDSHE